MAHLVNLGFALMIPAGVLLFGLGVGRLGPEASASWTSAALAFSAGTFLCVALSDLLPELQFHEHDRLKLSLALLLGVALMGVTAASDHEGRFHLSLPDTLRESAHSSARRGSRAAPASGGWGLDDETPYARTNHCL